MRGTPPSALLLALCGCVLTSPDFDESGTEGATDSTLTTSSTGTTSAATSGTSSTSTTEATTSGASDAGTSSTTTTGDETSSSSSSTTGPCEDGDTDGICDLEDNCPEVDNPGQEDADGDTYGDPCDVCNYPGLDDDGADYDNDGIPCALDPCSHDGPNPPSYPSSVGPTQEITISNASINGAGTFVTLAPDESFALDYHWLVHFCQCDTCVTQGMVGISGNPPAQCFYNEGSGKNCKTWESDVKQMFTAPSAPGIYYIRARRTWEYVCQEESDFDGDTAEFAAICVK